MHYEVNKICIYIWYTIDIFLNFVVKFCISEEFENINDIYWYLDFQLDVELNCTWDAVSILIIIYTDVGTI